MFIILYNRTDIKIILCKAKFAFFKNVLKYKNKKLTLALFHCLDQEIRLSDSSKLISIDQIRLISYTRKNSKMSNITSKCFSLFNNTPP